MPAASVWVNPAGIEDWDCVIFSILPDAMKTLQLGSTVDGVITVPLIIANP